MKMKKIISVLLLALTLTLFSSCIIIEDTSKYDITLLNNTDENITDWCVKSKDGERYEKDDKNCPVRAGSRDTITDIPKGYYSVCFSFEVKNQLQPEDYEISTLVYLDEDVVFRLATRKFYSYRSASSTDLSEANPQYILTINGKEYPLVKTN